jgi:hypothetical protein
MPIFKQDGGSNKEWGEISTSGRTWLFLSTEIPVNTVQCAMENPQFRMFEEGEADNTGGIQLVFEEPEFLAAQLDEVTAVIECSMQELTVAAVGTIHGITGDIELNFVEPILAMQAGLGVSCTFEPFEIIIEEAKIMADINVLFKEPDGYGTGTHTYVSMDLEFKGFDGILTPGLALSMEFEDPTLSMSGKSGKVAYLSAEANPLDGVFTGGPPYFIDATMEKPEIVITGSNQAVNSLSLTFRKPGATLTGIVSLSTTLTARFNRMDLNFTGTVYPVGNVSVTFLPLRASFIPDPTELDADLEGEISLMRMMAFAFVDGQNEMNLEFKPHEITATDDAGDCSLADTLTYGG